MHRTRILGPSQDLCSVCRKRMFTLGTSTWLEGYMRPWRERGQTHSVSLLYIIVLMAKSMTYIFGGVTHFLPFTIPTTTTTTTKK